MIDPINMNAKQQIVRQGDLLLVPIEEIPKNAKRANAKHRRLILAEGEVTGHHHSIQESDCVELLEIPSQETLFLLVKEGEVLLEHQEHSTIPIQPGTYRIIRQREYSPEEIRNVCD